jgi:hypothetical protein
MHASKMYASEPDSRLIDVYRHALATLNEAGVPYLVGGAYAFERYTGIARETKDFDLFLKQDDFEHAAEVLRGAGYHTELSYPHWLGKAFIGDDFIDLIFSGGNGVATVDDLWFKHALEESLFDQPIKLCPVEEIIWSKAFIMERERFDGADVIHLLLHAAEDLDWNRLLYRFGDYWRVLFGHIVLFGFVYPSERHRVPAWVTDELAERVKREAAVRQPSEPICRGTLISRAQYLVDVDRYGYIDGRVRPRGNMSRDEIESWTAAIDSGKDA